MRLPTEIWVILAVLVGLVLIGILGGFYYAGWNLRDVFIENPDWLMVWVIVIVEISGIFILWVSRPWRIR